MPKTTGALSEMPAPPSAKPTRPIGAFGATATIAQPAVASSDPPPRSARSDSRPAAWPKKRPNAIDAPKMPGPRPLTAGWALSCRSRKSALQLSMPPSTTNAAAPRNPITSRPRAMRMPFVGSVWTRAVSPITESPVNAMQIAIASRIGSRPTPAPRASPAPTAPTRTPTEYVPCANGIRRAPVSLSIRPTLALIATSTSPVPMPAKVSVRISVGSVVVRPGRVVAIAKTPHPIATARAPNRSTAGAARRNIAGIEPRLTNSIARPSAPLEAPVASCTLGSTAAHAPQKSPSEKKPASVGFRRGSSAIVAELVDADGVARTSAAWPAQGEAELLRHAQRDHVLRSDVRDDVVDARARPRVGDRRAHRLRREPAPALLLGDHPPGFDLVRLDAADPLARVVHLGEPDEPLAFEHRPRAESVRRPVRFRLRGLPSRFLGRHERRVLLRVGLAQWNQPEPL